jgi:hypothetical protein
MAAVLRVQYKEDRRGKETEREREREREREKKNALPP